MLLTALRDCHCSFVVLLAHHLVSGPMVIVCDAHKPRHCSAVVTTHSPCHVLCGNMPWGTWDNQTLILTEKITDVLFFYCLQGSFRSSETTTWSLKIFPPKCLMQGKVVFPTHGVCQSNLQVLQTEGRWKPLNERYYRCESVFLYRDFCIYMVRRRKKGKEWRSKAFARL